MKKAIKTFLLLATLLLACALLLATLFPERVIPIFIGRQVASQAIMNTGYLNDVESITVVTVGTGSPLPGKRAETGTAVFVNGRFFMFDVGSGVVRQAERSRLPLDQLDAVFLTHYHSDHIMDLPNLINRSWVLGRTDTLPVFGPDGLDTLMQAVDRFLSYENQYRVAHHGSGIVDLSLAGGVAREFTCHPNAAVTVFRQDGITVTAFDVDHDPVEPAVGYVVEYAGKKVVISGDTKKNGLLMEMARDADLLVHEVMLMSVIRHVEEELKRTGNTRNAHIMHDIRDYHTSPAEVAELASRAGVKRLVLNHLVPPPDNFVIRRIYRKQLREFQGPVRLARDGDVFVID